MYCCSLWWDAFNVTYLATPGITPHPAVPLSFHQKPNISETIQIPILKPYILFFIIIICIQWHIPCVPQGSHCFNVYPPTDRFGGYSDRPSVRLSVCRRNLVRRITLICFELFSWNFVRLWRTLGWSVACKNDNTNRLGSGVISHSLPKL